MVVKETADVAKTADITKTGDETQNATETQTQNIKALKDAVAVLDPERLEELRWFKHAEKVISSNFLRHPKESDDSWLDRLLYPAQTMKQPTCPLDIIISKLRTTIEANGRKTPTLRRIKFVIWLGLLTRDWLEAEVRTCVYRALTSFADMITDPEMDCQSRVLALSVPWLQA